MFKVLCTHILAASIVLGASIVPGAMSVNAEAIDDDYLIIVNAENDIIFSGADGRAYLRQLFLKERTGWPDGKPVTFLARSEKNTVSVVFRERVLEATQAELRRHWLRQKQTRGETPPRQVSSTRLLMRLVARNETAISVVSKQEYDMFVEHFSAGPSHLRVAGQFSMLTTESVE